MGMGWQNSFFFFHFYVIIHWVCLCVVCKYRMFFYSVFFYWIRNTILNVLFVKWMTLSIYLSIYLCLSVSLSVCLLKLIFNLGNCFLCPSSIDQGHIVHGLSVCSFVCLFFIGHIFWLVRLRAFIFHMSIA